MEEPSLCHHTEALLVLERELHREIAVFNSRLTTVTCVTSLFSDRKCFRVHCMLCMLLSIRANTNYLGSPQAGTQGRDSLDDSYPYRL